MFQGGEWLSLEHLLRTWSPDMHSKNYLGFSREERPLVWLVCRPRLFKAGLALTLQVWLFQNLREHNSYWYRQDRLGAVLGWGLGVSLDT
jgi:hypothetical protein